MSTTVWCAQNKYHKKVKPHLKHLANRGIGYVELRAVDVNPYSPIGIDEHTAGFLEVLALYCLLQDSPALLDAEQSDHRKKSGRSGQSWACAKCAQFREGDVKTPIEAWGQQLCHRHATFGCFT